jgi:phosphoribosyl-ATP pyrophosphohydrolase
MTEVLQELEQVLAQRREADPATSYVASLHRDGLNKILEKLSEECTETILAAKDVDGETGRERVIYETADLWFHSMVMLSHLDLDSEQVLAELKRRFHLSGLEEKASRRAASE